MFSQPQHKHGSVFILVRKDTLSLRCLKSIISKAKEFVLNILILKLVEDLGVNILFSSLVMINYVQ